MQCEVCGSECEKLVEIRLEGARVLACQSCTGLGQAVRLRPLATEKKSTFFYNPKPKFEAGPEVVVGLGGLVRNAREKRGLKREELAKKIFEKASVIHRIESGNYIPDDKTIKKLEVALGLKLTEEPEL